MTFLPSCGHKTVDSKTMGRSHSSSMFGVSAEHDNGSNRGGSGESNPLSKPLTWLGGLGAGAGPPGAGPGPRRVGSNSAIADEIRNDQGLFFADDGPPPMSLSPSVDQDKMTMTCHHELEGYNRRPIVESPSSSSLRRHRISSPWSSKNNLRNSRRHSSQQKMDDLQREVDMALEFFSQETENELDHFDGDDYLNNRHEELQRVDKVTRFCNVGGDGECDSLPGTAATSMATSVFTDDSNDCFSDVHTKLLTFSEQHQQSSSPKDVMSEPQASGMSGDDAASLSLKKKTKSILSFPSSLLPSQTKMNCSVEEDEAEASHTFENAMGEELHKMSIAENCSVDFNSSSSLRSAMEPFLAVARLRREAARQQVFNTLNKIIMPQEHSEYADHRVTTSPELSSFYQFHIGSTYGVPYPALRNEMPFLYDVDSFPLSQILAETLGVEDLSKLHIDNPLIKEKRRLMAPLKNRGKRRKFHQCFDSFVTSHVIPLLHSQALSKGVFYTNRHQLQKGKPQSIVYRYQTFPSINIVRPGECSTDPHCDMAQGHSIGTISYHIPLTATFGTNALYAESRPGREDWHPLEAGSPGLGFQFDGARCLHFNLRNATDATRVSLNFRVAITRAPDRFGGEIRYDPDDQLCCPELLRDEFSMENPGFHEEVVVYVGEVPRSFMPGPVAVKRRGVAMSVVG
eukprot:CAMPEP_0196134658 /NCGR_PEP_ID=MMETSP0910-20130528/3502_1 /TAXON_ID=49265 /ORGANISM="Thalassiosira rotula, Strain GSO102" /LENGTH=684 /DNA_ID=CAMNT_0041394633 /DNA_START=184 /DNA_END=2238 /DNA_ORIENTATION=+